MFKKFMLILVVMAGFIVAQTTANAQKIAIVENFDDPEIDSLQSYLSSMGLKSKVINKDTLSYDEVANYDLLIWDDLSYQMSGITDSTVSVFNEFYQTGRSIYFIGDDLAYCIINLSQDWATVWTTLIHLSGVNNFSQYYTVFIADTTHPVTNGLYGKVHDFDYSLDIDFASATNTGELVLGRTSDSDVLLAFDSSSARTVTQNCLVVQAGSDSSVAERNILFKNAVAWLLKSPTGVNESKHNQTIDKFSLSQNYPNPFNPTTSISFELPKKSYVSLRIFDIIGREVATIASEEMPAGRYTKQWNAVNMASGIYFYRLVANAIPSGQAGPFTETKKLVLLK